MYININKAISEIDEYLKYELYFEYDGESEIYYNSFLINKFEITKIEIELSSNCMVIQGNKNHLKICNRILMYQDMKSNEKSFKEIINKAIMEAIEELGK